MSESRTPASVGDQKTVLEAEEFVLKDTGGRVHARLGMNAAGTPGLRFFDGKGRTRIELVLFEDRVPAVVMYDASGEDKAALLLRNGNYPMLRLSAHGTQFEVDVVEEDGSSRVSLGSDEVGSVTLGLDRNTNHVGLTCRDAKGTARADLWVDRDGLTTLRIEDARGRQRVNLNDRGLTVIDEHGKTVWSSIVSRQTVPGRDVESQPSPAPKAPDRTVGG